LVLFQKNSSLNLSKWLLLYFESWKHCNEYAGSDSNQHDIKIILPPLNKQFAFRLFNLTYLACDIVNSFFKREKKNH